MDRPPDLARPTFPLGDSKIHFTLFLLGTIAPTYSGGFTTMNRHNTNIPERRKNISNIGTIKYNKIYSEVSFSTTLPLNLEGILSNLSSSQMDIVSRHHSWIIIIGSSSMDHHLWIIIIRSSSLDHNFYIIISRSLSLDHVRIFRHLGVS